MIKNNRQDILLVCFIVTMSTLMYFGNLEYNNGPQQIFTFEINSDKFQDITAIDYSQITLKNILEINDFKEWNDADKKLLVELAMKTSTDLKGSTNYSNEYYLSILDNASPKVKRTFYMILSMWVSKYQNTPFEQKIKLEDYTYVM